MHATALPQVMMLVGVAGPVIWGLGCAYSAVTGAPLSVATYKIYTVLGAREGPGWAQACCCWTDAWHRAVAARIAAARRPPAVLMPHCLRSAHAGRARHRGDEPAGHGAWWTGVGAWGAACGWHTRCAVWGLTRPLPALPPSLPLPRSCWSTWPSSCTSLPLLSVRGVQAGHGFGC